MGKSRTPELSARALADALSVAVDGLTLQVMAGPHHLPAVGLVARLAFYDLDTLEGPAAELVLVPDEDLARADEHVARLAARAGKLGRSDLERPLAELLELDELVGDLTVDPRASANAALARVREQAAAFTSQAGWRIPDDIAALVAMLDATSSWQTAALEALAFRSTVWLRSVLATDEVRDAALQAAASAYPVHPAEFVHLFDLSMDLHAYGYLFDAPDRPVGFAAFFMRQTGLLDTSPCLLIANRAERAAAEPEVGAIQQLERLSLAELARLCDAALPATPRT